MKKEATKKSSVKKNAPAKKPAVSRVTHKIDAEGKAAGRLATEISILLRGKNKPDYQPNLDNGDNVLVINAAKMKFSGQKLDQKTYYHYSGYQGGLKRKKMGEVFKKDPAEVLKRTIWNMMPKNKLRNQMLKRLKITN